MGKGGPYHLTLRALQGLYNGAEGASAQMAHCSSAEHHQQPFRLRLLGSGAPSFLGRGMFDERRCGSSSREAAAGRWGQGRRQRLAAKAVLSGMAIRSPHRLLATIAPAGLPEAAPSNRPPLARCGNARAVDGSWCRCRPGRCQLAGGCDARPRADATRPWRHH